MQEYYNLTLYCLFVGFAISIVKKALNSFFDIAYCYFTIKEKTYSLRILFNNLLLVDERRYEFLDLLSIITVGLFYLIGNYIFLNGVIRLTPLLFMLISYFITQKFFSLDKKIWRILSAIFISTLSIPSLLISNIVSKIIKK